MRVPHATDSAALVRHRIGDDLLGCGIDRELIDEVVLVASELIGNAILHTAADGAADLGVDWTMDATGVTVRVSDSCRAMPRLRDPDSSAPGGRGLHIVDAICDDWGVRPAGCGKQVWAHVPLPA